MPLTKVKIGNLIRLNNQTNADGRDLPFYGLNKDKEFMPTVASITKVDNVNIKWRQKDVLFLVVCKLDEMCAFD